MTVKGSQVKEALLQFKNKKIEKKMTVREFDDMFDVLFNNITSNQAPGLNAYEKSVFLTKAEYQLVNEYFNSRTDGVGGGFDGSQIREYDFSNLIRIENLFYLNTFKERITDIEKLDRRSKVYLFPMNYHLAVSEILSDSTTQYSVMPLDYREYQRLMLKPYNFPVRKGAWRLITDKKNCNYAHESYETDASQPNGYKILEDDDNTVVADYKILTSWADQKRTMDIHIHAVDDSTIVHTGEDTFRKDYMIIAYNGYAIRIETDCTWGNSQPKLKYLVNITVKVNADGEDIEDEFVINALKEGFKRNNEVLKAKAHPYPNGDLCKAMQHTDGFQMCSAPSKLTTFQAANGRTFSTHVVQVPMAEIIGKFNGVPSYQMRFVRKLNPIILEDLDNYGEDLSINGISTKRECELPEETHQEILERAVTLAKIAWQGGTATQAAAQRNENR